MKSFNFVHTLNATQKRAINKWLIFSTILFTVTCISITYIQIQQLYQLYTLKIEKKKLMHHATKHSASTAQKQKLTDQVYALKNKNKIIDQHQNQLQNSINLVTTLKNLNNATLQLQSAKMTKNNIEIIVHCANQDAAGTLMHTLHNASFFKNTKLTSLKPVDKTKIICTATTQCNS